VFWLDTMLREKLAASHVASVLWDDFVAFVSAKFCGIHFSIQIIRNKINNLRQNKLATKVPYFLLRDSI